MSTQLDWRTLPKPKGTTHVNPNCKHYPDWYQVHETVLVWERDRAIWVQSIMSADFLLENLVPIDQGQQAWNGEGLPPVGIECEHQGTADNMDWLPVKIIAHTEVRDRVVAVFQYGDTVTYSDARYFRPIRTPEQIAAEERVKAAQEWLKGIEREYGVDVADKCEVILMEAESSWQHDNHKPDFPKSEEQASSEVHQDNRELAEQRLRRLAELDAILCGTVPLTPGSSYPAVHAEKREILSHYRVPPA